MFTLIYGRMAQHGEYMKVIKKEYKLCFSCMEEHEVEVVKVVENNIFKGEQVEFIAIYEYCSIAGAYSQTEEMIKKNDLAFKNAYHNTIKS